MVMLLKEELQKEQEATNIRAHELLQNHDIFDIQKAQAIALLGIYNVLHHLLNLAIDTSVDFPDIS
jgi:hypothetical protein